MFGFDGEYRRRPIQSLGGASQTCDRETVIKKAQQERQRRNEMRIRNNSAIVLQSYTRSFVCRQRQKNNERRNFDEFMQTHLDDINADDALAYLLPRLIFFYNLVETKDAERLIELCQHILKNYQRLLSHAVTEYIWVHRVQRLLEICIKQLKLTQTSQAIPLRMLETFTAKASVASVVENEELVGKYFQQIFQYLISHGYFQRLKELLEVKCPPLDGEILHAPSAFTKALLQLILRPLTNDTQELKAYESFAQQILAPEHTEAVRLFLIPCIAESEQFCFEKLIDALDRLQNSVQLMEVDNQNQPSLEERTQTKTETFSSFLLYSLFRLDGKHLSKLHT